MLCKVFNMRHLQTVILISLIAFIPHIFSQNCPITFDQGNTRVSKGATPTADTTRVACESVCKKDSTCVSYQIDTNVGDSFCWIQRNANPFVISNLYIATNTIEYKKIVDCSACTITYKQQINLASLGAQSYANLTSQQSCENFCTQLSTCFSYQINSNPGNPSCWIQQNHYKDSETYSKQGVAEYKKSYSCLLKSDCDPVFNPAVPTNVTTGATPKPGIAEPECKALCLSDYNCASYQIDLSLTRTSLCWIQYDITKFSSNSVSFYLRPEVTEYFKNTTYCYFPTLAPAISTTSCPLGFYEKPYANASLLAVPNATFKSNDSCRQACFNDPTCVSYQIDTIPTEILCWFQYDIKNLDPSNTYTRLNVVEFVKGYICKTTTPTITTSSKQCTVNFVKYPDNQASFGAQAQTYNSNQSCADACKSDANCYSYQISLKPGDNLCYFQRNNASVANQYQNIGVVEFVKNITCTTGCDYYYRQKPTNVSSISAVRQAQTSVTTCQSACTINLNCYSYQFNDLDKSCWFQFDSTKVNDTYFNPFVTEYVKTVICGGNTTVSTTPTTATTRHQFPQRFQNECVIQYYQGSPNEATTGAPALSSANHQ